MKIPIEYDVGITILLNRATAVWSLTVKCQFLIFPFSFMVATPSPGDGVVVRGELPTVTAMTEL